MKASLQSGRDVLYVYTDIPIYDYLEELAARVRAIEERLKAQEAPGDSGEG